MNTAVRKGRMVFILSLLFSFSCSLAALPAFDMGEKPKKKLYARKKVVPVQGKSFRKAIIFRGNVIPLIDIPALVVRQKLQKIDQGNPPFSP